MKKPKLNLSRVVGDGSDEDIEAIRAFCKNLIGEDLTDDDVAYYLEKVKARKARKAREDD